MAEPKARPLTAGMASILKVMAEGKPHHAAWTTGPAHNGGLVIAMRALRTRGLVDIEIGGSYVLTDAGRAAAGVMASDGGRNMSRVDEQSLATYGVSVRGDHTFSHHTPMPPTDETPA